MKRKSNPVPPEKTAPPIEDLIVLVADLDQEMTLKGLLDAPHRLSIRAVQYKVIRHQGRDVGCCTDSHTFLRPFINQYHHALVIFDQHGSGGDNLPVGALEDRVQKQLNRNGWDGRSNVVVIAPELERWVWSTSPIVDEVIGWKEEDSTLREWLLEKKWLKVGSSKPDKPKEALEAAMRHIKKPRSAALYQQLAQRLPLESCTDVHFNRLLEILRKWFPAE
ncbi:MAG: hypothetical protein OHK0023_28530 [Anaerolineae bacterium]